MENYEDDSTVEYPINGTLDLHVFKPSDIPSILDEYIHACLEKNILHLRVIHGKGKGVQRKRVTELLTNDARVASFRTAGEDGGGWGATLVDLLPNNH
jgi:DNA-nicking Smr family endonuclease